MSGWRDFTELRAELRALSSATSLNVLHQLGQHSEINVTDLAAALALSQPLVSWHLRNLRRVGLVRTRRRGREVICSLDRARFDLCLRALGGVALPDDPYQEPAPPTVDGATGEPQRAPPRLRAGPPSG